MKRLLGFKLRHKCHFKTIKTYVANGVGEIWIQKCECGKTQRVLFDGNGICRDIKLLKDCNL